MRAHACAMLVVNYVDVFLSDELYVMCPGKLLMLVYRKNEVNEKWKKVRDKIFSLLVIFISNFCNVFLLEIFDDFEFVLCF